MPNLGPNAPRALLERVAPWLLTRGPFQPPVAAYAGKSVATLEAVVGDTIWIPFGWTARVQMTGKDDAEAARTLDSMTFGYGGAAFRSTDDGIFMIGPDSPPDPSIALLTSTGVGAADLVLGADADPGQGVVSLQKVLTVHVYKVAIKLVVYYTIQGEPEVKVGDDGIVTIPINRTANVRFVGVDDAGQPVAIQGQVISDEGSTRFHVTDNGDGTALLTPDLVGAGTLAVSADVDPSPGVLPFSRFMIASITESLATHIVASAGIQAP